MKNLKLEIINSNDSNPLGNVCFGTEPCDALIVAICGCCAEIEKGELDT